VNGSRQLLLLRHAKSDWADAATPDAGRPLSREGRAACGLLANHLARTRLAPDLILCSSALRTRQTVERIGPGLPRDIPVLTEDRLYLATAEDLLSRLRDLDDGLPSVLLVGHNPGIHELAVELLPPPDRHLMPTFPTAALAVLDLRVRRWAELGPGATHLGAFTTPRALRTPTDPAAADSTG
jgi:phosphohistidine phosphatase